MLSCSLHIPNMTKFQSNTSEMKIVGFYHQLTPTLHIEEGDIQIGSLTIDYRNT